MILSDLLLSLEPLVNLWMSALILDELIGARDIKRLVLLVLVTVGLNFCSISAKCAGEPPSPSKQNDGMGEGEAWRPVKKFWIRIMKTWRTRIFKKRRGITGR
mgnify:CR=1 FL=1